MHLKIDTTGFISKDINTLSVNYIALNLPRLKVFVQGVWHFRFNDRFQTLRRHFIKIKLDGAITLNYIIFLRVRTTHLSSWSRSFDAVNSRHIVTGNALAQYFLIAHDRIVGICCIKVIYANI